MTINYGLRMFLEIPNESRIKSRLRYSRYALRAVFTWKLKVFFRRIKVEGFNFLFLGTEILYIVAFFSLDIFVKFIALILYTFFHKGINFRFMSMSEYHEHYCRINQNQSLYVLCHGTINHLGTHMMIVE